MNRTRLYTLLSSKGTGSVLAERAWLKAGCPKLHAIGLAVDKYPKLAKVWARNFG